MPKVDYLTNFLSKNVYNYVLCINGSKVTALKGVFETSTFALLWSSTYRVAKNFSYFGPEKCFHCLWLINFQVRIYCARWSKRTRFTIEYTVLLNSSDDKVVFFTLARWVNFFFLQKIFMPSPRPGYQMVHPYLIW